jgi:3-oxoacyl-[acyl-carrier protein] reductase
MDLGLQGKVAMVAAASKGLGLATARLLAKEGCQISICARNEDELERAAAEIGEETRTYVADVTDAEDLQWWVDQTRQDLGPIDILVTNTGGPPAGSVWDMSDEDWKAGIDSTLMNVIRLVGMVRQEMSGRGWGRIVHITSYVAKEPSTLLPISSTLRAGLIALTKVQARELAPFGVTVNGVLPGNTLTDRQRHLAQKRSSEWGVTEEEALNRIAAEHPMKRMAEPEEIASVVTYLCSAGASFLSGQSICVDGGASSGLG